MKNVIHILQFILILILAISCTNHAEEQWAKTLKIHDEIMVKMQKNGEVESKLNELLKLAENDTNSILFSHSDTLKDALEGLIKADEEMMDWMANIKAPQKGMDMDSVVTALKLKEQEIILVGKHMDDAAEHANAVLNSLKK